MFLDQSYVTETTLNSVSPNEEFSCSLGELLNLDYTLNILMCGIPFARKIKHLSKYKIELNIKSKKVKVSVSVSFPSYNSIYCPIHIHDYCPCKGCGPRMCNIDDL